MSARLKSIGKLVAANLVVWLVLEAIAFVALMAMRDEAAPTDDRDWLYQARISFEGGLYVWDEHCLWTLAPGYRSDVNPGRRFWGDGPLVINRNGHRGPDRPVEKPAGVRRVLILGGSHPMGMYVDYEESYGAVLERLLNDSGTGPWEVLNAAAPGHTSFQAREYLAHHGLAFEPDIVISDVGVNDTLPLSPDFPTPDHEVSRPPAWAVSARSWLSFSAVYRLMKKLLKPAPPIRGSGDQETFGQRVPVENHDQNLNAIGTLAKNAGAGVLYVTQFSVDLHGSGRAHCIYPNRGHEPSVDVCALWLAKGADAGRFFVDPIHANAEGHALIGRAIFERLRELKLLNR